MKDIYRRSFTLIEIIIVIGIIAIFSALSMGYYNTYTEEKKLDGEEKKIIDIIELARKKAQSGDIGGYSCSNFDGYQVVFAGDTYYLRICCADGCSSTFTLQSYKLPQNITATISGSPTISFSPLNFHTNLTTTVTITVKNAKISKCIPIAIYPSGLVDEGVKAAC